MERLLPWMLGGVMIAAIGCGAPRTTGMGEMSSHDLYRQQKAELSTLAQCSVDDTGLHALLGSDGLFKSGHSSLSKDGKSQVDAIAAILLKHPTDRVTVKVYTDKASTAAKALRLTLHRADAIKAEWVKQGISADNLTALGKGIEDPVAPNDNPADQAKNRRVKLDIVS